MNTKWIRIVHIMAFIISLSSCGPQTDQIIANRYAQVVLTRNNELQFRFRINLDHLLPDQVYKVKVSIHNQDLVAALGTNEIIYGEDLVYTGEYLQVNKDGEKYIYMKPILLQKDLHPFEIEKMIVNHEAVSVEVFSDTHVLGKAVLTNFVTQL
jgi:hypothetical protein